MEIFPNPKISFLTASILYFLTAVVLTFVFLVFGKSYTIVMVIAVAISLSFSLLCYIKHLGRKERQFKILYSLEIAGFTEEKGLTNVSDFLNRHDSGARKIDITNPAKNVTFYYYKFFGCPEKDFVVVRDLEDVPELNEYRVFVRPPVEEKKS